MVPNQVTHHPDDCLKSANLPSPCFQSAVRRPPRARRQNPAAGVRLERTRRPAADVSLILLVFLRLDVAGLEQLLRREAQQAVEVTDEAIDVPLPCCLVNDVLVVVVAQTSRQLLIVHLGLVFADAPSSSNLIWVGELELPAVTCPGDEVLTRLICQLLQQELPQLDWSAPCADRQQSTLIV